MKDLCARLPCGVKVGVGYYDYWEERKIIEDVTLSLGNVHGLSGPICYWSVCIPYLHSMSSMTEKEKEIYNCFSVAFGDSRDIMLPNYAAMDWLNAHHFDYRGLIERGLALEAPKGMYEN